jgi:tRNA1Val (adenine37-N6)-methyltransferase
MPETLFRFKRFKVSQKECAMKINTDGVLLGAWADVPTTGHILDVGTGSGVIAMMLAQRSSQSRIVGVEIDENSFYEARANMEVSEWSENLEAVLGSIQEYSKEATNQFDLIVSNPPFFSGGTLSATQKKTDVRHAIKLPHSELLRAAYHLLDENGVFSVVLPYIEGLRFIELAEQYRFFLSQVTEVRSFPDSPVERLLISFRKNQTEVSRDSLSIRDSKKDFSEEYRQLTKDFYLKF